MKTSNQLDVVALSATELRLIEGGDTGPAGVWIGEDGKGCIPGIPLPKPPYKLDPYYNVPVK